MSGSSSSASCSSSSSASSSSAIRSWRTAFLTLRDETLTSSPKSKSITQLLNDLIFSSSRVLISAAPDLPSHEVTSDLLFLMELATSPPGGQDVSPIFTHVSSLVHDICKRQRVALQLNSSSWVTVLNCCSIMVQFFLAHAQPGCASQMGHAMDCLGTVRYLASVYRHKSVLSDDVHLTKFLIGIIESSRGHCLLSTYTSTGEKAAASTGSILSKCSNLWEVPTAAFDLLSETFTKSGPSFPANIWQSATEVTRKVMDTLVSQGFLVEGGPTSRFYAALLGCLHLLLTNAKGSQNDHVPAFVATLRMFFTYGIPQSFYSTNLQAHKNDANLTACKSISAETKKDNTPYRPPHLRRKGSVHVKQFKVQGLPCSTSQESYATELISSDSDYSDSDASVNDSDTIQSSKVRTAAIVCLQDLCQADPKSFTAQWTLILPTTDVLEPRKFEATLLTCLLYDPYLKVRMASASTLAVMLDGPSSVFLQVAEYKGSSKFGSFMALSSSLGRMLMQLHAGLLHLIKQETHSRLLASLFKILMLLISATPYSRMPAELLPRIVTSLLEGMEQGFPVKGDQSGLLAASVNCLTATLSTSPSSLLIKQMLAEEISRGVLVDKNVSGILSTIFRYSEQLTNPPICFEALQTLRAVMHNYPSTAPKCWEHVASLVSNILKASTMEVSSTICQGSCEYNIGFVGEKVITAAIKVTDECLRAISGFKGTEELCDDKFLETPFAHDCIREKKVSSAPLYEKESVMDNEVESHACETAREHWSMTIDWLMPLILQHNSHMVRTASITIFAGITSSVFGTLSNHDQDFIVHSSISAAVHDEVASVRAAACRAIGVISCFPQISHSAEILDKFIGAIVKNTNDPLASVRIAASWALANICDSLRHCVDDFPLRQSTDSNANPQVVVFLMESALRLTKGGDKIKSNAVRALGNLSKIVRCMDTSGGDSKPTKYNNFSAKKVGFEGHGRGSSYCASLGDPSLLQKMVQAFLSCVTTGNVKVQWNVCHAISNLFINETLRLQDMDWAPSVFSILLLLLRDSSNFKIRIQAAAALAVPASVIDYGESFPDVLQGLEHVVENLSSDQISAPSSFKYRVALEKQVTSTMLHVLSLTASSDQQSVIDFLVRKALYLEEWFKLLCSSVVETSSQVEDVDAIINRKKQMIFKAIQSLIQVYGNSNHHAVAEKFKKLEMR
ncbi:HEAT repeat-containing protein 6 [Linum perenne]